MQEIYYYALVDKKVHLSIMFICLFALLYVIVNYKQVFSQGPRMVLLVLIALGTGHHILKLYEELNYDKK
jgi:hypothetical protein